LGWTGKGSNQDHRLAERVRLRHGSKMTESLVGDDAGIAADQRDDQGV
jgi:hypothetical protein